MGRSLRLVLLAVFLAAGVAPLFADQPALAVVGDGQPEARAVVVVADVRGPLEQRSLDFLTAAVRTPDADLVVLQINNPGIASGDPSDLFDAISTSTTPVTAWVGPVGAEAYGGVAEVLTLLAYRGAAPGAKVGYLDQRIAGGDRVSVDHPGIDPLVASTAVEIETPVAGVVDEVVPTIGQFIATLDERPLLTPAGPVTVNTAETTVTAEGAEVIVPVAEVRFLKPTLLTRTLRLSMRPEATFFFLVAGLALVVFELYAAGVGITAAVAVMALFLSGFGVASLPIWWPGLIAAVVGVVLYTVDFQNASVTWRSILGTAGLVYGGLFLTDAAPQFAPRWWAVLLVVVGVAAFYLVALTTVARSRFSTTTIGRDHLIGRTGIAETGFDPTGVVAVDGARWRARSHRAAGLSEGDSVEVLSVAGIMLEVGPVAAVPPTGASDGPPNGRPDGDGR